jgi:energy-coupling factor transporter ATP-binding protein EcfA2
LAAEIILETTGLTKEFKGFVAVNHVDLKVRRGHIHALIGPNGAGKTTFFNLLTKFLPPTAGTILSTVWTSRRAARADRAPRHRPLVPDIRRVPPHDRAGKRARGAAAQAGHLIPLLEAREPRCTTCTPARGSCWPKWTCRTLPRS